MSSTAKLRIRESRPDAEGTVTKVDAALVRAVSYTIPFPTDERTAIYDLTPQVRARVAASGIREGLVNVASFHTTTAIIINENQAALREDVRDFMSHLLPRAEYYRHNDPSLSDCARHNADAHLKAVLLGQSVLLSLAGGSLLLGQYQSVLFVEFDGPQSRTIHIHIFGATKQMINDEC